MISVVIPTMDDAQVFDALDSVLDQDHEDFEIVVVDGSSGNHRTRLENKCSEHGAVTYINESEHGTASTLNASRNLGIETSNGEKIALLDGDCTPTDGWLEALDTALEEYGVVESKVTYIGSGKTCPLDRAVENHGREYRFLGAGLAFRRDVWKDQKFREDLGFHGDTAFGFDALDNGYSYGFSERAEVLHHSGRFSPVGFVTERLRFTDTPLFTKLFRNHSRFSEEVSHIGPVLYPAEMVYLAALIAAAAMLPFLPAALPGVMVSGAAVYVFRQRDRGLNLCPIDLILLTVLVPLALITKRSAIWRGSVKHNVLAL